MIKSIDLYNLRNGEYLQLMQDVLSMTRGNDPASMKVQVPFATLETLANEIESLFKIPTGSAITAELEKFDLQRDNAFRGIAGIVRANTYSDDLIIKHYADMLDTHLALFGKDVAADSYQSETSSIRNIISDWDTNPDLKMAVTTLNLNSWRVALENANNSFLEYYLLRAKEQGFNTSESLKTKRLQCNDAYYALRDKLNAYYVIEDGAEPYKSVVAYINGLLENYNTVLGRRRSGDEEESTGNDTPPVTGQSA